MTPEEFDDLPPLEQHKFAQKVLAKWVLVFISKKALTAVLLYQFTKFVRKNIK